MMTQIYHEKQSKELCALHVLNNIFQSGKAFTKKELDQICFELSPENWINPHKSVLGFGNYDVNVVTAALNSRDYDIVWFDRRKDPSIINLDRVYGYILNLPSDYKIGWFQVPFLRRKHWVGFKFIEDAYYNLDSKLKHPARIGTEEEFLEFVRAELQSEEKQFFLVIEKQVADSESWRKINS